LNKAIIGVIIKINLERTINSVLSEIIHQKRSFSN